MPLTAANMFPGGPIKSADAIEYFNLLTGAMTDQPVTLANTLSAGGSHGVGSVPFRVNGVAAQTANMQEVRALGTDVNPIFAIGADGSLKWGPGGGTVTDATIRRTAAGILTVSGLVPGITNIQNFALIANAPSFDFNPIPATYRHLMLILQGRGDVVAVTNSTFMRFNNDATGNYQRSFVTATGAVAPTTAEAIAPTSLYIGEFPGASASANYSGMSIIYIPNYAGTVFNKTMTFDTSSPAPNGAGTSQWQRGGGIWAPVAAINRITVLPPGGSGNWIPGSVAALYGIA